MPLELRKALNTGLVTYANHDLNADLEKGFIKFTHVIRSGEDIKLSLMAPNTDSESILKKYAINLENNEINDKPMIQISAANAKLIDLKGKVFVNTQPANLSSITATKSGPYTATFANMGNQTITIRTIDKAEMPKGITFLPHTEINDKRCHEGQQLQAGASCKLDFSISEEAFTGDDATYELPININYELGEKSSKTYHSNEQANKSTIIVKSALVDSHIATFANMSEQDMVIRSIEKGELPQNIKFLPHTDINDKRCHAGQILKPAARCKVEIAVTQDSSTSEKSIYKLPIRIGYETSEKAAETHYSNDLVFK